MIATQLLQIVVTVFVAGQPPIVERLPELYKVTSDACEVRAKEILALKREGVDAIAECEPTDRRAQ